MCYPPSQQTNTTTKKRKQTNIVFDGSMRCTSGTISNQPEPLAIIAPINPVDPPAKTNKKTTKKRKDNVTPQAQTKDKGKCKNIPVSPDSPAMGTRSKRKLVIYIKKCISIFSNNEACLFWY
ncbi:hypothetical protein GUJ93_ZPchr0012g21953 [Zizania palustris]|uniref:Uncharacterized protein n=1 Tax=Zizania palustris TaxID=103762 RepID=A0A8J5WQS9_ZIZPA|nr:hypothetical protein GUJ93_ZPchr0012g21953 [Zizania palustris]